MQTSAAILPEKETGRLEAFSDGVFAIAITLLILELKVPVLAPGSVSVSALAKGLLQQWPSYISLVTSFFTILVMWIHHHALFTHVRRCDAWVHYANGVLLLAVTFVPYPTSVLATYLNTPAAKMAAAFYAGTFVMVSLGFNLVLRAAFRKKLLVESTPPKFVEKTCRDYMTGIPAYMIAVVCAFIDVRLCLAVCTALWIFWASTVMRRVPE